MVLSTFVSSSMTLVRNRSFFCIFWSSYSFPASPGDFIVSPRVSLATSRGSFDPLALVVFLLTYVSAMTSVSASVAFLILNRGAYREGSAHFMVGTLEGGKEG